jgi:5-methylcytosine-specific restriction protein B
MAREANEMNLPPVIAAYQQWIAKCLIADGSLFSSANLWTPELVEEVRAAFVDHPDMGKESSFWEKLKKQMQNASPAAKHLMAEMIWAMLAFPCNINAETKRNSIRAVWAYSGEMLSENSPLLNNDVLVGIGSGGQGYLNGYWRELTFIIKLTADLKKKNLVERQQLFSRYDGFVEWISKIPEGDVRQFRHILRYVAFPDHVERIASNKHRQEILERFGVASEKETRNWGDRQVDEAVFELRVKLQKEFPGQILDFYEPPLKARWKADEESSTPPMVLKETETAVQPEPVYPQHRYWTFSAGEGGEMWEDFYNKGIAAIGWDDLGDLTKFKNKEEIRLKLQELFPGDSSQKNNANACWQFAQDIKVGDIIFAKQGFSKLFGYGVVESDYHFDGSRQNYQHTRQVRWQSKGEWEMPAEDGKMAMKTLTDITRWPDFVKKIGTIAGLKFGAELPEQSSLATRGTAYWWLNANPKIWDFRSDSVGAHQTYTSHNDKGNKRRIYEYFQAVKPGDLLLGYVTSPEKEIVAIGRITKSLHTDPKEGEVFEFEKIEQLKKPVAWSELQSVPALTNCEPLVNNQGSLFRLTQAEFDTIRKMSEAPETDDELRASITPFTEADALQDLFIDKPEQLSVILSRLRRKKALILQGPPGVGKTFVARRIAYALMGYKDDSRIHMVQFHPSYGYEDFIQGYRPTRSGSLERRDGVFYEFARSARNDPRGTWVFIIDEINRGNLAKVFGELLMLLEAEKRGPKHSVSLTYSEKDEEFYLPENLFVIGTMNTADRSLAMVDYALRRRFAFATFGPALDTTTFANWFLQKGASKDLLNKIRTGIAKLNSEILKERGLGEDFCIGHSFFCPADTEKPDDHWYSEIIDSEIKPLLKEYFESADRVETLVKELLQ